MLRSLRDLAGVKGDGVCADGPSGLPAALESNALKCWSVGTLAVGVQVNEYGDR